MHHVVVPKARRASGGTARRWLAPFAMLTLLGAIGAVAQLPLLIPLVEGLASDPGAPDLPFAALVALSLVNPLLLLVAAVAVGLVAAPRVGLVSHLVAWARHGTPVLIRLRRELPVAIGLGAAVGAGLMLVDAFVALLPERDAATTLAGVLYGGLTEELITRWGLMSALAWGAAAVVARSRAGRQPPAGLMWGTVIASALAFGALHLPFAATLMPLTPGVVALVLLLNGLGGVAYGWLFWRRSLEAAMLAHATSHLAMTAIALVPAAPWRS